MIIISLTEAEVLDAEKEATTRNDRATRGGIPSRKIEDRYTEEGAHLIGARGEAAVVKGLGRAWTARDQINLETWEKRHEVSDVEGAEVRTTPVERGHLWLYPRDKVGRYLLVVEVNRHRYRLVGWMHSDKAKDPKYWRTPDDGRRPRIKSACFFIPQRDLRPAEELRA